jgi:hypothetical protein
MRVKKIEEYIHSLGLGGLLSSGLAGLFFLCYPHLLPPNSSLETLMIIGALLGTAAQRLANALILNPFMYYAKIGQLILLRRIIGKQTQERIIQDLTIKYFLGADSDNRMTSLPKNEREHIING